MAARTHHALFALACLGGLATVAAASCSEADTSGDAGGSSVGGRGGGGEVTVGVQAGGGDVGSGGACASLVVAASVVQKPVDIIFLIDNSASMADEADAIEENINVNFSNIIQSQALDYRVIMITDHGAGSQFSEDVCVGPPLSGTIDCGGPPVSVPGRFYHYDIHVDSLDAPCRALGSLFGGEPDAWNQAPNGWIEWLRPAALKVFIAISDDQIACGFQTHSLDDEYDGTGEQTALQFEHYLLQTSPAQFGYGSQRNYVFYSLVGLAAKPDPLEPYTALDPIVAATCPGGVRPGVGYQALSKLTGGLRFPGCNPESYDAVFQDIAASVIDATDVPCEFDVPEAPPGQMLDLDTLELLYTAGGDPTAEEWLQVEGPEACGPGKFYIDEGVTPMRIHLCPEACALAAGDEGASIQVRVDCAFIAN
jgi:hypothetical protein